VVTNNVGKGLGAYKAGILCMWVVGMKVTTIVTYGKFQCFFFFGRHFAKFQPEKYEFDLCKGILMKKMAMGYGLWDTKECEL